MVFFVFAKLDSLKLIWRFLSAPFPLKKKARLLQRVVFSAYNLTLNGPFFLQFLQSYNFHNSYLAYEVIFLYHLRNSTGPKCTHLEYIRLCETFFRKKLTKESPFTFLIFSDRMDVEKSRRVPPFSFFRHCETFLNFLIKGSPIHQYFDNLKSFCYFWGRSWLVFPEK